MSGEDHLYWENVIWCPSTWRRGLTLACMEI